MAAEERSPLERYGETTEGLAALQLEPYDGSKGTHAVFANAYRRFASADAWSRQTGGVAPATMLISSAFFNELFGQESRVAGLYATANS